MRHNLKIWGFSAKAQRYRNHALTYIYDNVFISGFFAKKTSDLFPILYKILRHHHWFVTSIS